MFNHPEGGYFWSSGFLQDVKHGLNLAYILSQSAQSLMYAQGHIGQA